MRKAIRKKKRTPRAKYMNALVTFMDILGFAQRVDGGAEPADLVAILDKAEEEAKEHEKRPGPYDTRTVCVSDCFIRAEPVKSETRLTLQELGIETFILGIIQLRFLAHGLLVRGAIAQGKIYVTRNRFFGPAYQAAYRMESGEACYPRVILQDGMAEKLYDPLMVRKERPGESTEEFREVASQDDDGRWFVDYLKIHLSAYDDEEDVIGFLRHHKKLIVDGLKSSGKRRGVLEKYWWMRRYHNRHVESLNRDAFRGMGRRRSELLIKSD